MSIDIRKRPTQESADARAILDHVFKGKPVDPEVSKRVRARAEKVREEMRKQGLTNFAVDLLRESRDE
jgi:hypothetical protein